MQAVIEDHRERSAPVLICLFNRNPDRSLSLLEIMKRFKAVDFGVLIEKLSVLEDSAMSLSMAGKGAAIVEEYMRSLKALVEEVHAFCQQVAFTEAGRTAHIAGLRLPESDHLNVSHIETEARHIREALLKEAFDRVFLLVDKNRSSYVDNDELFGAKVKDAFPSAVSDIREAGNCFAAECSTATIFHLMRVAEHGLRALARDRRIELPKKAVLDLATWEDIIKQLELAEVAIQGYPKTLAREKQYEFYHGAMMEFKRFKNVVRNPTMHTRDEYDMYQALSVMTHTSAFMQILAGKISERKRTPVIWKRA